MFKVGMEAFTAEGPMLARYLISNGQKVFLDLKFHDIPNTVRGACRAAAALGVTLVNVHAFGGRKMLRAAAEGAEEGAKGNHARPRVLAVTMLTSLADQDLEDLGIAGPPQEAVLRLARLAQSAGLGRRGCLPKRSGGFAPGVRAELCDCDAWHPAGRRRVERPVSNRHAGCGACRWSGLSGDRPPHYRSRRPGRGGPDDFGRDGKIPRALPGARLTGC